MRFLSKIEGLLSDLTKSLIDFLFPHSPRVIELESLSSADLLRLLPIAETSELDSHTIALYDYSSRLVKEVIWEIKYSGNRILADKLGELLYDHLIQELNERNLLSKERSIILMPMPVSDRRRFERGWNQAELLAAAMKRRDINNLLDYVPRQLAKVRHTESQTRTTGKSERLENLRDSMKVLNPLRVHGECVVVIDDVVTTGSTFAEARRALKEAGAKKILCMAVAH